LKRLWLLRAALRTRDHSKGDTGSTGGFSIGGEDRFEVADGRGFLQEVQDMLGKQFRLLEGAEVFAAREDSSLGTSLKQNQMDR